MSTISWPPEDSREDWFTPAWVSIQAHGRHSNISLLAGGWMNTWTSERTYGTLWQDALQSHKHNSKKKDRRASVTFYSWILFKDSNKAFTLHSLPLKSTESNQQNGAGRKKENLVNGQKTATKSTKFGMEREAKSCQTSSDFRHADAWKTTKPHNYKGPQ